MYKERTFELYPLDFIYLFVESFSRKKQNKTKQNVRHEFHCFYWQSIEYSLYIYIKQY